MRHLIKALVSKYRLCCLTACAILAGCHNAIAPGGGGQLDYGVYPPSESPDPTLELVELTYSPVNPITLGTEVIFTATANHFSSAMYWVHLEIAPGNSSIAPFLHAELNANLLDDGQATDAVAQDGVYTGELTLPLELGARDNLPVIARGEWNSTATPPSITGEPMDTVLPEGE